MTNVKDKSLIYSFSAFLFIAAFVSNSFAQINQLAISPDGKSIAITYEKDHRSLIYKVNVSTGIATRLTNSITGNESSPAFSPNGEQIAYSYRQDEKSHSRIVIENVNGSNLHSWSPQEVDDFRPVFSSDNKAIIFGRSGYYGSYSPIAQPYYHEWNFYESELDGTNVRQLTDENFYMVSPISISPDGRNMMMAVQGTEPGQIAIYSVEHPSKKIISLRPHVPNEADHKDPIVDFPNYMPDGKSVLFMAASNGKHGYDYDVYQVDIATGALKRFTKGNGFASDLKVSADGKIAAFLKWHSNWRGIPAKSGIYLLDLQTDKSILLEVSGLH